jgi:hypothetical protein
MPDETTTPHGSNPEDRHLALITALLKIFAAGHGGSPAEPAPYYIRRSSYPLIGLLVDQVWTTTSPTITWWVGRRIFVC